MPAPHQGQATPVPVLRGQLPPQTQEFSHAKAHAKKRADAEFEPMLPLIPPTNYLLFTIPSVFQKTIPQSAFICRERQRIKSGHWRGVSASDSSPSPIPNPPPNLAKEKPDLIGWGRRRIRGETREGPGGGEGVSPPQRGD